MARTKIQGGERFADGTLEISDINPGPLNHVLQVTSDGTAAVWVEVDYMISTGSGSGGGSVTITSTLPASPSINDIAFYIPFESIVRWDGSHWVGPKIFTPFFGKRGQGNTDAWLEGIGYSRMYAATGVNTGYYIPGLDDGIAMKICGMSISNTNNITGTMEIHKNASEAIPTYATSGVISVNMTSQKIIDSTFSGVLLNSQNTMQCYWRMTSGQWKEFNVILTYSLAVII